MKVRIAHSRAQALGLAAILLAAAAATPAAAQNFIGAGAAYVPEYEGGDDYEVNPVPLVNYSRGNFFISGIAGVPALGLRMPLNSQWSTGVFVGAQLERDASDSDRLEGLDDIDTHAVGGAYLRWADGPFSVTAAYRHAMKSGYGGTVTLDADYRVWQSGRNTVRLGLGTQWSNNDAMDTYFGVSTRESRRSREGLDAYDASSGFRSATASVTWMYAFDNGISAITTVGARTLLGDARDSPITERETSPFGMVGLTYAF